MSRITLVAVAAVIVGLAPPAPALGAPPPNDDYLLSTRIVDPFTASREPVRDILDLTEATTQPDLFIPGAAGGGGPETISCNGTPFGKTVWYDLKLDVPGRVEVQTAGTDVIIALYEYDADSSQITDELGCTDEVGSTEDVFLQNLEVGRSHTLQIGAVDRGGGVLGGPLQVTFDFFPDTDEDGIFDPLDECKTRKGVKAAAGCLPVLNAGVSFRFRSTGDGVQMTDLRMTKVRKGTRMTLRCTRGCDIRQTVTAPASTFDEMVGRALDAGDRFQIRVTRPATNRPGRFRFGAIGQVFDYTVAQGSVKRRERCLYPGTKQPRKRCPQQ